MKRLPYLLLAPAVAFFLLSAVWPILLVGQLSFFRTNYITSQFIGLGNYLEVFSSKFLPVLANSALYVFWAVAGTTILTLTVALMLVNSHKGWQDVARFSFYIPALAAGAIMSMVWRWIWHPSAGLANWILGTDIIWMGERYVAIIAISIILITSYSGTSLIIYMAAILAIPFSLYESARIDGANWMQIRFRIILPIIAPTIFMLTLIGVIGGFQIWEVIYFMSPIKAARNLMFDIYESGFIFSRYGLASAKSIVLMAIILAAAILKRRLERER